MVLDTVKMLPYLTGDWAGVGGRIKVRQEDFFVEELPLYQPAGQGTHVYALIEKRGIPTMDALSRISRALGVSRRQIGFAGLKDARAVTRQWISVEHIEPQRLESMELERIKVLELTRHNNKIKLGHLAGNRFVVRIRDLNTSLKEAVRRAEAIMAVLAQRGVANYFGPQRFGNRNDSHLLGEAIVRGDHERFIELLLGLPDESDLSEIYVARTLFEQGEYRKAYKAWPGNFLNQRQTLRVLLGKSEPAAGKPADAQLKKRAYNRVDKYMKRFFVSAFQSDLFNAVLAARMPRIDEILSGDIAYKHANGACFRVTDAAAEQERCRSFEISPTGPLVGQRMTQPDGPAGQIEERVLSRRQFQKDEFRQMVYYQVRGGRRPLRFQPRHGSVTSGTDEHGAYLKLAFELDSGCYATTLLREITKNEN